MASATNKLTPFRIGALNVHIFLNPKTLKNNAHELATILAPYNLDVLATEEVVDDSFWTLMCNQLGLSYRAFGQSHGTKYGNAIGSRFKIQYQSNQRTCIAAKGGHRSMLCCRLDGNHPFTKNRTFAVTHLDHIDEHERLEQIKEFSPISRNVNVLVGDMNALTRDDYTDNYFDNKIVKIRENSYWESPKFELTNQIVEKWGYEDAFRKMNPALKDEQVSTCAYGTRIDYIFLRSIPDDEWVLSECFIVNTQPATDHNAVIATFAHKSTLKF